MGVGGFTLSLHTEARRRSRPVFPAVLSAAVGCVSASFSPQNLRSGVCWGLEGGPGVSFDPGGVACLASPPRPGPTPSPVADPVLGTAVVCLGPVPPGPRGSHAGQGRARPTRSCVWGSLRRGTLGQGRPASRDPRDGRSEGRPVEWTGTAGPCRRADGAQTRGPRARASGAGLSPVSRGECGRRRPRAMKTKPAPRRGALGAPGGGRGGSERGGAGRGPRGSAQAESLAWGSRRRGAGGAVPRRVRTSGRRRTVSSLTPLGSPPMDGLR